MSEEHDLRSLPQDHPREFIPPGLDLGDWEKVEPLFDVLEREKIGTRQELERWLRAWSELEAALDEEGSIRYARMTCQTDDPERERAYLHFIEEIEPRAKPRLQRLRERYTKSPARGELAEAPASFYYVLDRNIANQVALFRQENVPLEMEEAKLAQRYQKIVGAMTVQFQGQEQTLQQMARYLEEPDRAVRREAWELSEERRLKDREEIEEIYDELLALRERIARNAGFSNYRDYAFRKRERFDYTPEDCLRFHQAVEEQVVPLLRDLQKRRQAEMGLEPLRPWDLLVDPQARPPLRPFTKAQELVEGCEEIFRRVGEELGQEFQRLRELRLLDLVSRKGKAPGAYSLTLAEKRLPFIFANFVGRDDDLRTMLHESGHAFHALAAREQPLHLYRGSPLEFAEVASMGMELLGGEHIAVFYKKKEQAARSKREHLEGIIRLLPWVATIDAFQHWLYTHPGHSRAERREQWLALRRRFGGIESWQGYEEALAHQWKRQLHLFEVPFYYIEYGIAQLGALGVWQNARRDSQGAIAAYRRALALGGSRPLPQLFGTAGLRFDFSSSTVAGAARALRTELLG
ncbi:MAG: M3 family oligoendopeptidase [Candidatus Acetothermia bacterium]|nr:M3 family oligoendopeptidase [Candidatus Acetothermia bacterium]MDH7506132.1 M3 family oligoendopeptidase [Candidatus Acetothermia bacterium]